MAGPFPAAMSCISLPKSEPQSVDWDDGGIGWTSIVRGIRIYALRQPQDEALELLQWADFLEGVSRLEGEDV